MTNNKIKYQRYLSIDLNTKTKSFSKNAYSSIKYFLIKRNFHHLKDTNYLSKDHLSEKEIIKIERDLALKYPKIIDSIKKFNWSVWDVSLTTDTTTRIKKFKSELLQN